jgi:thymidylate kinase
LRLSGLTTLESARIVDDAALDRVLVHGSPPGEGRDLDLLVRPRSEDAVAAALLKQGFRRSGHRFVRFRRGTSEQIELFPASWWDLPDEEERALFDDAVPLEGFEQLVRPSPAHTLLILGRRVVEGVGVLDEKRRRYVDWAVARDPNAWGHAAQRADAWHGERTLELLERLVGRGFVPRSTRAKVVDDRLRAAGWSSRRAHLEAARRVLPRRRRPAVVSLSGLDGSGKSTQARLLVDTFDRMGVSAALEWAKLGEDRRLWAIRRWGRRLLLPVVALRARAGDGGDGRDEGEEAVPEEGAPQSEGDGLQELRRSSGALSALWASITVASVMWTYRRQAFRYRGHADLLVYDRYVLDSAVHLRWRYGLAGSRAELLTRLLQRGSPAPSRAFFLRLDPVTAQQRKLEDRIDDLVAHDRRYAEVLEGPAGEGVIVLDAGLPPEELAAQIADAVLDGLENRAARRRSRLRRLIDSG